MRKPAKIVYCGYENCKIGWIVNGPLPPTCPECLQPALWTTTPPFNLTEDDKIFMHCNKILNDEKP